MGNETDTSKFYNYSVKGNKGLLVPVEPLTLQNADEYDTMFSNGTIFSDDINSITLDCGEIKDYDTYFLLFYTSLEELCRKRDIKFETKNVNGQMERFIKELAPKPEVEQPKKKKMSYIYSYLSGIGNLALTMLSDLKKFIEFIGSLSIDTMNLIRHPKDMRWKDFPFQFTKSGVNAVPIIMLINFLIGIITGYQGAIQLHQFGADRYLAKLVGLSITRELAPLMTAILVAGRSGSAFAAELGTMKVSEEIDALQSMGFDYLKFLVLPRVLAVAAAMPLLVLLADVAGLAGGLLMGVSTIDLTMTGYLNDLQRALTYADIFSGIFKGIVFGYLVATVGCFRGMQVRGGAESVGRYTTISVVSGVLLIILSDALFTFVFQAISLYK